MNAPGNQPQQRAGEAEVKWQEGDKAMEEEAGQERGQVERETQEEQRRRREQVRETGQRSADVDE